MLTSAHARISVVIPTYNRSALLSRTLQAYCHQSYDSASFDLVIVDDGSTDDTESVVRSHMTHVPYRLEYLRQHHAGPASARNQGLQIAAGDRILFSGDDIFPDQHLLEQHALTSEAHPDAAILGLVEWSPDLELTDFMRYVAPAGAQFDYSDISDPLNCGHDKFYGANISLPARWARCERFDESIRTATVEDHEYGYRLEQRGLRIVFNRHAIGYHYHPMTHASFLARTEEAGKAIRYLWEIHPELERKLRPLPFVPLRLLQMALAAMSPACRVLDRKLFWKVTMMNSYLKGIRHGHVTR